MSDEHMDSDNGSHESGLEFDVLHKVLESLRMVNADGQRRIIDAVTAFLGLSGSRPAARSGWDNVNVSAQVAMPTTVGAPFSESFAISPKQFLHQKQPKTDVERVACLAYYLTNYRDTPYFKTIDLTKLNTEAAQPKFSNAANATNNALKLGYLVQATKGQRQLSAAAERFVEALPDRDLAKTTMSSRPKRRSKKSK